MISDDEVTMRDTESALDSMEVKLRQAKEIGIFIMSTPECTASPNALIDIVHAIDAIQQKLQALINTMEEK